MKKKIINFFYDSKKLNRPWSFDLDKNFQSGTDFSIINLAIILSGHYTIRFYCTELPQTSKFLEIKFIKVKNFYDVNKKIEFNEFLIFCYSNEPQYLKVILEKSKRNKRFIVWLHNTPSFEWFHRTHLSENIYRYITVSDSQRLELAHTKQFDKIVTVPNIIKYQFKNKKKISNRKEVLFIGSITPSKGFLILAKIWHSLIIDYPKWKLKVAGDINLYSEKFKKQIDYIIYKNKCLSYLGGSVKKAKKYNVFFKGNLNNKKLKKEILNSKFIIVNPNFKNSFETFCNAAGESLMLGRPVIGASRGSLPEIIGKNYGGLLHNNENELRKNLIKLFDNQTLIKKLGIQGHKNFSKNYAFNLIKLRWILLLNESEMNNFYNKKISIFHSADYFFKSIFRIFYSYNFIKLIKFLKNINFFIKKIDN